MKKHILLLASCFFCLSSAFSQTAPGIEWQNTIGGSYFDWLRSISQTTDGGYILAGSSDSPISGDKTENSWLYSVDYWLIKTDSGGNILWQNTIGGTDDDVASTVEQTADGGYIIGGYSRSDSTGDKTENCIGNDDYWIVKTDSIGNIQWQNTIGGNSQEFLLSIIETVDGGYILGGESGSGISGDKTEGSYGSYDYWVVKIDSIGNIQWQNDIGGNNWDALWSIEQTPDGGFILGGTSSSNISGDKTENSNGLSDYWIVKIGASGNIQWQNTIGGNDDDVFSSLKLTSDGGYILGGYSSSNISGDKSENNIDTIPPYSPDYWIVKIDSLGNVLSQKTIGGSLDDNLSSLDITSDGGYVLGGYSWSNISGHKSENNWDPSHTTPDYWIVKTDSSGNIIWENTIGGIHNDRLYCLQQTTGNGFILAGETTSGISGDKTEACSGPYDCWIVKLYPDTITSITEPAKQNLEFEVYPNPFINDFELRILNFGLEKNTELKLFDVYGKEIISQPIRNLKSEIRNLHTLPAGVYFVKVGSVVKKVIKLSQ